MNQCPSLLRLDELPRRPNGSAQIRGSQKFIMGAFFLELLQHRSHFTTPDHVTLVISSSTIILAHTKQTLEVHKKHTRFNYPPKHIPRVAIMMVLLQLKKKVAMTF